MQQRYRLEGSSIGLLGPPTHSTSSLHPISPRHPPPFPLPGWYDLLDYKTSLPCVCLFSVPAERERYQAPGELARATEGRGREGGKREGEVSRWGKVGGKKQSRRYRVRKEVRMEKRGNKGGKGGKKRRRLEGERWKK